MVGEGPETEQLAVDFDTEVILMYAHGSGVNFGACGLRFDGYGVDDSGLVVLDFFSPGGYVSCDASSQPSVLATAPPVVGDVAAGTISKPLFPNRSGSTEPARADLPVPEGWEADHALPAASVTGRGGLELATFDADDPAWQVMADPAELELTDGPTALAVPLYQTTPDGVVTTGESASVQQYRHGSSDPNRWLRRVVWVYRHGDLVTVAVLGYPEFPDGSSSNATDSLQSSLAGQDPLEIMNDIRFFSAN